MTQFRTARAAALALIVSLATAVPAQSQNLFVGVEGGFSIASLNGEQYSGLTHTTGFSGGVSVSWQLHRAFAATTGVYWIPKGTRGRIVGFEEPISADLKLGYIQVPLLAELSLPTGTTLRPSLFAGPAIGFEASCSVGTEPGELALTLGCDGDDRLRRRTDWSIVAGAGVSHGVRWSTITLNARYDFGLTNINRISDTPQTELRTRAFLVTVGARVPLTRQ